ncbi:phospholipid phosphatase 5-like [Sycon ciliatum]|uniref:phospholipid phosphatase 5-like n=1 Tax=Sycon ciliatum TaxID=27933 RepID=UPI0020AA381F|eukprot:scpid80156/ scgid18163/ Phosphatidate phosphatase PPAPDC1B; Phosphatidic acid phosphatase type 2 domain-containing protein 1B
MMDSMAGEIAVLFVLLVAFCYLDVVEPFHREIHAEELWLYKNPHKPDTFTAMTTVVLSFTVPPIVMMACCALRGLSAPDLVPSVVAVSLSGLLTTVLNNILKLLIGRPRPDFYHRCFPHGTDDIPKTSSGSLKLDCTGDPLLLRDGRKSFPSGHSALSCSTFVFLSLYLVGQLGILLPRGRGQSWRLLLTIAPSLFAATICLSRYSDYRHHWQDVMVGSALGSTMAWFVYHQYFPVLSHQQAHRPLAVHTSTMSSSGFSPEHRVKHTSIQT